MHLFFKFLLFVAYFLIAVSQEYHVKDYNATGNGVADDTLAVRAALAAAAATNGGRVIFDQGYTFLTGCFNITSNVILDVRGTILASNDSKNFVQVQPVPWFGGGPDAQMQGVVEWQSVIRTDNANNITITGGNIGTIDGNGNAWWLCIDKHFSNPPCNNISRPPLIRLVDTSNIEINNIVLQNSPSWTVHLANTTNVHINNVSVFAPLSRNTSDGWFLARNTDGFDVDCSQNVLIENCLYSAGDDAIAVKAGMNYLGRTYGRTTENVLVRNLTVGPGCGGLSIGSEMSAGVRNVTFRDIIVVNAIGSIHMKSERGRGGTVQDITYDNIHMINVTQGFRLEMNYHNGLPLTNYTGTPKMKNIVIKNVVYENPPPDGEAWLIDGLLESPFLNIQLSNITYDNRTHRVYVKCDNVYGSCDASNVLPYCPPCFKPYNQIFKVQDFNATGDGFADDTQSVRAALTAAEANGGGRVTFDAGRTYLTACFNVSSNVILDVQGTILASSNSSNYVLVEPVPWFGGGPDAQMQGVMEWQSVIRTYNADNITITGGGIVDGQGQYWWPCQKHLSHPPCSGFSRPPLVRLVDTTNIEIYNITFQNSPSWTLHLANTTNVHANNVRITAPSDYVDGWFRAVNTDGFDIDCSKNVLIENSYYSGGDDAIAVKAGMNYLGRTFGRTTENVLIRNLTVGTSAGLSIGSEMSAGVRNVTFQDITMNGSVMGIHLKSQRGRGGTVENITYTNIIMHNVTRGIFLSLNYSPNLTQTNDTATPKMKNIYINNVVYDLPPENQNSVGWILDGLPESHFQNVNFANITISNKTKIYIDLCDNIEGTCDSASVFPSCPPCINSLKSSGNFIKITFLSFVSCFFFIFS